MNPFPYRTTRQRGFTLIELVMIIVILGILSAVVYERWPVGMEEAAAAKEFKRAVRYAQHKAMTRQFTTAAAAWGITVSSNSYTVRRQNANCLLAADAADPDKCAEETYRNRALNDKTSTSITGSTPEPSVWFNGLGEPIYPVDDLPDHPAGSPLDANTTFTIKADGSGTPVTIHLRTGYVE